MQQNDDLIALVTGTLVDNEGKLSIESYTDLLEVEVGDYVIGEVVKLYEKSSEIQILSVEGKANRSIEASQLFAQLHVTKITDRFLHHCADGLRRRDIVRAKVIDAGSVLRVDMREEDICGILWALCPPCGDLFTADQDGDWNVLCPTCDTPSVLLPMISAAQVVMQHSTGQVSAGVVQQKHYSPKEVLVVQHSSPRISARMAESVNISNSKAKVVKAVAENDVKKPHLAADYSSVESVVTSRMKN